MNESIEFDIKVNGKKAKNSIKEVEQEQEKLDKTTSKTASSIKGSWIAIGAAAASTALIFKQFQEIGDEWTTFSNKIKLSVGTLEEYNKAQSELFRIAQETSSEMGGTVDLYQKLSQATRDLGTSQEDIFSVIETVNQSLIISGASASEANASIRQLGQGLASGVLRGDEFNSIMENSPRIAKALSDSLGVTIGQLRKMAENGELTSKVVTDALRGQADIISSEYDGMTKTVDQSFTLIKNSLGSLVSGFNDSVNGTDGIASILQDLSKFLDENADDIIDFGEDIVAVATIVKNGLYSIYLTSKIGYIQLTQAFKSEIGAGLDAIVEMFESTLNYIIREIDRTSAYWSDVFGTDFGQIGEVSIGKISIDDKELQASLEEAQAKIQELGKSTDEAFKELVTDDVKKKVVEIKEAFNNVVTPVQAVDEKLKKVKNTAKEVKKELTDIEQVYRDAGLTAQDAMTGAFVSWQEGAFNFKDTMRNVLNDISAMIVQKLVVKQLFDNIGGAFGGGGFSSVLGAFAKGAAFNNGNVTAFAQGGVVGSPTVFPMANGMGLMGEAGAEAIMPLSRTSSGDLGVKSTPPIVNVNVQNYGNDNVKVEQSGDNIQVIISQIASSISRGTGDVGKAMESRYGLSKR